MKKKYAIVSVAAVLLLYLLFSLGIGPYSSASAVQDLTKELTVLHGDPYTGRKVENRREDMTFSIEPDTFFLTNYNLRNALGLDYHYRCEVNYTVYQDDEIVSVRTVSYTGIDPMGQGKEWTRAYLEQA